MDYSVYTLFGLDPKSTPREVLKKCIYVIAEWQIKKVTSKLLETMPREIALVNAKKVYEEGHQYLKTSAAMLMDPSARQCYDAWLEVLENPSQENRALTKARFLWYNQQNNSVKFSESMLKCLGDGINTKSKNTKVTTKTIPSPICRQCRCEFDFYDPFLVLHCHCTTRVGHNECLTNFHTQCNGKCPVCRQTLLMRYQVSKYLFWNVRDKFKLIM